MRPSLLRAVLAGWVFMMVVLMPDGAKAIGFPMNQMRLERLALSPQAFDFWKSAEDLGASAKRYTEKILQEAAETSNNIAEKIVEFNTTMSLIVSTTTKLRGGVLSAAQKHGLTLNDVSEKLSVEFDVILEQLKVEFSENSPDGDLPAYEHRVLMVDRALVLVDDSLAKMSTLWGASEEDSRAWFGELQPHIKHVLLVTGNLVDRHPAILETIVFSVAIMLIPEAWLLRPLLSIFGFGPSGPIKGSVAAWAQRRFWGGAVAAGSWFARLQSAGMVPTSIWGKIIGSIAVGVAIGSSTLFRCRK